MTGVAFDRISKHYGAVRAVDVVSLTVEPGEFATILGPSGSGKTTMLSIIAGITEPTEGAIRIGGRDVTHAPPGARNIGLVFQSYALFPHMNVAENVGFPLGLRRIPAAERARRVAEALAMVRLDGFGDRRPSQLSGGQQQRVALARAIVFKPDILLLDEPLAALDRKLREEVRAELHQLQRRLGITTIMVTHDQDEALSLSDRIVVLHNGRVEQIATPAEAYHRPRTRFVAEFLGLANFVEGRLEPDGSAIVTTGGLRAPCRGPRGGGPAVGVLRPEDLRLADSAAGAGLPGRIVDAAFFGETIRYGVEIAPGLRWTVRADKARAGLPEGAAVTLDWDPGSVWLLPEAPEGARAAA